jgi:hypothetical protein
MDKKRMQKLAGLLKEEYRPEEEGKQPVPLTREEMLYLESEVERFLNASLFGHSILSLEDEETVISREELAIRYIIKVLEDRISYY